MIEKEDGPLFPVSFQGGEKVSPTGRGLEELAGDRFFFEYLSKKNGPFNFISRGIHGIDAYVFLKISDSFI
jgi:hypothetical protein